MIGYLTLGTNDLAAASDFYGQLLGEIGAVEAFRTDTMVAWGFGENRAALSVTKPFDGKAATVGNGTMVALSVDSAEKVDALHAKALELGGKDEGAPGKRGSSFYGGYFRDLDGNKLNFYYMGA